MGIAGNDFWQNQDRPSIAAKARGTVDRRVLQNVRRRLNRLLTNLVPAHCVPAIFACHKNAASDVSGRDVHALRPRFIDGRC